MVGNDAPTDGKLAIVDRIWAVEANTRGELIKAGTDEGLIAFVAKAEIEGSTLVEDNCTGKVIALPLE